ncbi:subtilisin-like protein [Myriangium duriaei CBS 260.36]|uniref:Subtilisin-like protein n=1 Tax=Myriangium duriaei CBS 260.36 TaxID=1168546 RepID=A0A9P4MCB5_9PEZI|nr:subtilisin-like protein [Myriangium duriaei CBS 260.36]
MSFVESFRTRKDKIFRGVLYKYSFPGFQAYAGHFDGRLIASIKARSDVQSVEKDKLWTTSALVEQKSPNWGLGLISHRDRYHGSTYVYDDSGGGGTWGYVVDSGINITNHLEFGGRARHGYNALKLVPPQDRNGHGTHIAGIMGSKTYGVAKKCKLVAIKVADISPSTSAAIVMDGYQWAVRDIVRNRRQAKAVINVSMNGPYSAAFNNAVDAAFKVGISSITSAGNNWRRVDHYSPGSAKGSITVAATDQRRFRLFTSNYGPAVSIFAPGLNILSTWIGGDNATARISGTSMAAAHVSGLVLYFKKLQTLPDALTTRQFLLQTATRNMVSFAAGSPNYFTYNGNGK